jgi:hypothetical protein
MEVDMPEELFKDWITHVRSFGNGDVCNFKIVAESTHSLDKLVEILEEAGLSIEAVMPRRPQ